MDAIVTALAEQGLVLGAILLLAIYMQAKIHNQGTALRREMSSMRDGLRKDIGKVAKRVGKTEIKLRGDMSDMKGDLRKDIEGLGERLARIEGPLPRGAPYDSVAERSPGDENPSK